MIAVVIPCYKVEKTILKVIEKIGPEVERIYVVDDKCPDNSGKMVEQKCSDSRVKVIYNEVNLGVGGATKHGFKKAIEEKCFIAIKIDGDDQMDTGLIPKFIAPIENGIADYVKGNRFFELDSLEQMPLIRLFGNSVLSFINKVSSGYYNVMDPTNGYFAIDVRLLKILPLDKIANRYFFESDMLFRLGSYRAAVYDLPIKSLYQEEESNLSITATSITFPGLYLRCFLKRVFYTYFLRDFNIGTFALVISVPLFFFSVLHGIYNWMESLSTGVEASAGTVMISALGIIVSLQFLLFFIQFDISNTPKKPISSNIL